MGSNKQVNKKRKKRLLYKRLRAGLILTIVTVILILAVKGAVNLIFTNDMSSSQSGQSQSDVKINSSYGEENSNLLSNQSAKPPKTEFTTLVNARHPLTEDYAVETRTIKGTQKLFDVRAVENIEQMLDDAAAAGFPMFVVSTYRTIEYQEGLYSRKVNEYLNLGYRQQAAEEEAAKWVAIPGTSEHNLGLVADIVSSTWYNTNNDLTQDFENTEHFNWLYEHCADYGFILRYPKGKESITGIEYEPWHYRYVGVEAAKYIMDNDLTLEEFWED